MKKWVCKVCGYIYEGPEAPAECPVCHAKSNMFEEVKGEMKLAAEHEFGVYAKTVKNNDQISAEDKKYIFEQLMANFNGECSELQLTLNLFERILSVADGALRGCLGTLIDITANLANPLLHNSILHLNFSWKILISCLCELSVAQNSRFCKVANATFE